MKAHRTDIVSFAFGLVFLGLALWWLLARILGLDVPPVGWFLAGGLVVIGLLGLVGALRSVRGPDRPTAPAQPDQPDRYGQPGGAETTVAAPYRDGTPAGDGPAAERADEWATDAVTEVPASAREDLPVTQGADRSTAGPATGKPATAEPEDRSGPATRELPAVDPEAVAPPAGRHAPGEPPA
ncbi:hypothetical protein [Micromonospora sp. RP3T]|uniref:hypothetical protein n=1 Tax=Micromonospora sp. RP3T TaxID=2135446 RepID=UPI000D15A8C2|nr:hypothetical protein [Micromonospora sp. RP3T]PTA44417.1 hypothetical protein C8054_20175 [Micromonospora sp. RP3T]